MGLILVIDDAPIIRELLKSVLEADGHEVLTAEDGDTALGLFATRDVDLSIVDIFLPGRGGLEVIGELVTKPGHRVIAISGGEAFNPGSVLELADIYGVARTFSKPIDTRELARVVKELLAAAD
ncbi:MAG: response regulator [Desulfovibrionaceae bacterium]|jgi:CheY-like chemotaxis protein|nr:response regulator [Desulfovibrionaceae bacterium]